MKVLCLWICKKDKKVVIQVFKGPPQQYFPINVRVCAILFFKRAVKICVGKIQFMSKVNINNNNQWDINLSSNSDINKSITVSYFFCSSQIWVFRKKLLSTSFSRITKTEYCKETCRRLCDKIEWSTVSRHSKDTNMSTDFGLYFDQPVHHLI